MKSAEQPSFMLTKQAESMRTLDLGLAERWEKTQEISGGKEWWMCLDCENGATHMHIKLPQANIWNTWSFFMSIILQQRCENICRILLILFDWKQLLYRLDTYVEISYILCLSMNVHVHTDACVYIFQVTIEWQLCWPLGSSFCTQREISQVSYQEIYVSHHFRKLTLPACPVGQELSLLKCVNSLLWYHMLMDADCLVVAQKLFLPWANYASCLDWTSGETSSPLLGELVQGFCSQGGLDFMLGYNSVCYHFSLERSDSPFSHLSFLHVSNFTSIWYVPCAFDMQAFC